MILVIGVIIASCDPSNVRDPKSLSICSNLRESSDFRNMRHSSVLSNQ